jgi:nitrogenase molybdenum-iron protein alpha/beta subunit
VPIPCAGFRGDQNYGADIALDAILRHGLSREDGAAQTPSLAGEFDISSADLRHPVCLIAPHANANPTWMGDLAWVKEVLARMGATVIATVAHDTTLDELERIRLAEACVVLSHDAGQKAANLLTETYGIEQWCRGLPLPIGFTNTRAWLMELGCRLGAEREARALIADAETMVVRVCRRKGLEQSAMHRAPAAVVADATVGVPLLRFITEDLEMIPQLVCLRSGQEGTQEMLEKELEELCLSPRVIYNVDVYQAKMALAEVMPEMVLGSAVEQHAVAELGIPYVSRLVNPVRRFRLSDRAYWGYAGMLNLIEFIQNDWWDRYRSKSRRYKARW